MNRFPVITVGEPPSQWAGLGLTPGAHMRLIRNGETFRIIGTCRGRKRLLLRRVG